MQCMTILEICWFVVLGLEFMAFCLVLPLGSCPRSFFSLFQVGSHALFAQASLTMQSFYLHLLSSLDYKGAPPHMAALNEFQKNMNSTYFSKNINMYLYNCWRFLFGFFFFLLFAFSTNIEMCAKICHKNAYPFLWRRV
jgi:hypothetical protein